MSVIFINGIYFLDFYVTLKMFKKVSNRSNTGAVGMVNFLVATSHHSYISVAEESSVDKNSFVSSTCRRGNLPDFL